jgi:hypothetical protein
MSGYEIYMHPGSYHFIVYNGEACDRDNDNDGTPNCLDQDSGEAFSPQFTDDIGCNDKGLRDSFQKSFIAGAQMPVSQVSYPSRGRPQMYVGMRMYSALGLLGWSEQCFGGRKEPVATRSYLLHFVAVYPANCSIGKLEIDRNSFFRRKGREA